MKFTAQQLALILKGKVEGNTEAEVWKLSKIEEGEAGSLTFLANPAYASFIYSSDASVCIVNQDFVPETPVKPTLIRVENAQAAFIQLLDMYNKMKQGKTGISEKAGIAETAVIGDNVYIGDFVFIGEHVKIGNNVKIHPLSYIGDHVIIGDNTIIDASVSIYSDCVIGSNSILHSGAVIGADGFGYVQDGNRNNKKIAQIGNVIIEDEVEIGSNTTIDRATMGSTIIRRGCKIDNLVMIAHNVEVEENTIIIAQAGIAGSVKIGRNCILAGQVGIVDHLKIGDNVKIGAQAGVSHNIPDNDIVLGSPAIKAGEFKKLNVYIRNLPKLNEKVSALEKELKRYRENTNEQS